MVESLVAGNTGSVFVHIFAPPAVAHFTQRGFSTSSTSPVGVSAPVSPSIANTTTLALSWFATSIHLPFGWMPWCTAGSLRLRKTAQRERQGLQSCADVRRRWV